MAAVSYLDRRDVTNRLARVHITDPTIVAGWLATLDPAAVHAMSDQDLAVIVGGTIGPAFLPPGSFGAGPFGIGPYPPEPSGTGSYPWSDLYPSTSLYPH